MSVYDFYRRKMHVDTCSTGKDYPTLGERLKSDSDKLMESTWDNDIQSKRCYVYDYFHDDFFTDKFGILRTLKDHMTYDHTNKTRIDAKFIIKSYQSMDKDQVEYYLQFKPSQKKEFSSKDELYYFETDYRNRYGNGNFIGLYVDVPDSSGIYRKWMICREEISNQFTKYLILPCSYELMWVENTGKERVTRRMWAVLRQQLSYTIGEYTDQIFTKMDNQNKIWLPLNSITENLWYTDENSKNMRVLVGALTKHPIAWTITKVENAQPIGIQKLTIYQNVYNKHTDYVNLETGEMYADFYKDGVPAKNGINNHHLNASTLFAKISSSSDSIKNGMGYQTLSVRIFNDSNEELTDEYSNADFSWSCDIEGNDWTNSTNWKNDSFNSIKINFKKNVSQLTKLLNLKCEITMGDTHITSLPFSLQIVE